MTPCDLAALSPLLAVAVTAVTVTLNCAFRGSHRQTAGLTLLGLAAAAGALAIAWPLAPRNITPLLTIDRTALFYTGLVLAAALAVAMFSFDYLKKRGDAGGANGSLRMAGDDSKPLSRHGEYYILLTLATAGATTLVSSAHFASFFLALELLSVSLYALVAYPRGHLLSIEAGIKYLILAGVSSAFLLFGMALVYTEVGAMDFNGWAQSIAGGPAHGVMTLAGAGMIVVGLGFKLSLVPFHLWAPDVYEGAPAPAAAFIATVSKGAVFALLLRLFLRVDVPMPDSLLAVFTLMAILSMFAGNWLAVLQRNVKRLLAYSSIAHMGYLLVAFLASGSWAQAAAAYYLTAYFVTTLGAFGVVSALSTRDRDADSIEDYRGLAWRRPWEAGVLSAMLLSLAGIPLTGGFVGKFCVLAAGVSSGLWLLVGALVVSSAIGLFYYLRVIVMMYRPPAADRDEPGKLGRPAPAARLALGSVALLVLTLALLWLGVYPAPAVRLIQATVGP